MEQYDTEEKSSDLKKWKKFPFAMSCVDESTEKRVMQHFKGPLAGLLQIENWIMSKFYEENADKVYNFEARPDDVYISTFPRSGTTWVSEMMWLLFNDLNYEAAKATRHDVRIPFLEWTSSLSKITDDPESVAKNFTSAFELLPKMTKQRVIKTHLPIKLLPYQTLQKGCKMVYVARNPKDVIVSQYHLAKTILYRYDGNFEQFVDFFMDDLIAWGPYFEHIKDGWNRRNDKNVLFLFYEDIIMDLKKALYALATFLECQLNDDDLPELIDHLSFDNFKENAAVNYDYLRRASPDQWDHIRRGKIGGNPELTAELIQKIDEWAEKQLMDSDLRFPCV